MMARHAAGKKGTAFRRSLERSRELPADKKPDRELVIQGSGCSLIGRGRKVNQDAFYVDPGQRYAIVADGLGGHRAGEQASRLAIAELREHVEKFMNLGSDAALMSGMRLAFERTNQQILNAARRDSESYGMGTTAVVATLARNGLQLAAVGDSRAYLVRDGVLRQLTTDQTVAQVLLDAGMFVGLDVRDIPNHNVLWNCLGCEEFCEVEPSVVALEPSDRIVLTSDGVSDYVDPELIAEVVSQDAEPQMLAEKLVVLAQQQGTHDDATCVVMFCNAKED